MSNRTFGVEIECYSPEGQETDWDSANGVSHTVELLTVCGFSSWANLTTSDDSLYGEEGGYGVEVKSPVLVGEEGFKEVENVLNVLNDRGYWVQDDCGLHVHIGAPDFDGNKRLIIKAVKSWKRNQHLINNMVDECRLDNGHCEIWDDADISELEENLRQGYSVNESLRGAINVGALYYHRTIEFRQHEGTLNPEEVISWVKFCQAFVDTIAGGTIRKISSEELFLKRLKVERNASRFLTTKARIEKERREARR